MIEAAKAVGVSKAYFYEMLKGGRRLNTDFIWSVSQLLGVLPSDLMVNDEQTSGDRFGGVEISEDEGDLLRACRGEDPEALMQIASRIAMRKARAQSAGASYESINDLEPEQIELLKALDKDPAKAAMYIVSRMRFFIERQMRKSGDL